MTSKREELKRKKQLQASFQLSFSRLNGKVESWVTGTPSDSTKLAEERTKFETMPIIAQGKGLSMETTDRSTTVSDFIHGKSAGRAKIGNVKRRKVESRSMRSLRNKIRDSQRRKAQEGREEMKEKQKTRGGGSASASDDSDDDDDIAPAHPKRLQHGKRPF